MGHFYLQKKNYTGLQEFHKYSWAYGVLPLDCWKEMGNIPQCFIALSVESLVYMKYNAEIMQNIYIYIFFALFQLFGVICWLKLKSICWTWRWTLRLLSQTLIGKMSLQYVNAVCHFHPYYCNTKILIACRPLSHTTKASFLKLSQNGMDLITKTANRIAKTSVMHLNPPSWPPAFL